MGGGLVMVQLRGTDGLFSMQAIGLAGSKLLWWTLATGEPEIIHVKYIQCDVFLELAGVRGNLKG